MRITKLKHNKVSQLKEWVNIGNIKVISARRNVEIRQILSDFDHPSIVDKANELTGSTNSTEEKIEAIFQFVRDDIKFGFPPKWDIVKASEVLDYALGYCNPKATLFLALLRATNISARIHCGLIDIQIIII